MALIVRSNLSQALLSWHPILDRLLQHYKPDSSMNTDTSRTRKLHATMPNKIFYNQLSTTVYSVPPRDMLVAHGDLNAVTGTHSANNPSVGPFTSDISSDNSHRFLAFCGLNNLSVIGSWFRCLNIHRWTWIFYDGVTKK